ncbi:MAG: NAD-dependent epimerase/dehydratase family protein, partial [Myxococcota bacterium]|nr:NAD-dependent epimerase/dehydratase family protein [Myxococcota bacterium]
WTDTTAALLHRVADWDLNAVIYVSSTSVYGDQGGERADEHTACHPDSPRGQARLTIEAQVLQSDLPAMVVRPAGIYGRGRSQLDRLADGRMRIVGEGAAYTNRIHVTDLAAIIEAACDRGTPGDIYLGADACPSTQAEVADYISQTYELPAPTRIPLAEAQVRMSKDVFAMITGSKRLDASWTRERLGVTLRYPDYRAGLDAIWRFDAPSLRARAQPRESS